MKQITIADVHNRLRSLQNINQSNNDRIFIESAQSIINSKRIVDIKRYIEGAVKSNHQIPFYIYTQLFETVIANGKESDIRSIGDYIAENVIPKVRDASGISKLLKGRLTRLQNKTSSPISKSIDDAISSLHIKTPAPPVINSSNDEKNQAVNEAYSKMLEKSIIMNNCDRVLDNYNKISKRFNLDKLFIENTRCNGVGDTVVSLCNKIDTYDMPASVKFNTIIETAWYGFESNSILYTKSEILETAVDYFMFKKDGIESCRKILEATLFYDKNEDMKNIDIITEEDPEQEETKSIDESIRNNCVSTLFDTKFVHENSSFNDIFEKFKKEELPKDDKPENKLKSLINKLYSRNVDSIVDETPDLLQWIRKFFIIGTCAVPAIGPVLMAVTFIADKFISLHYEREEVPKMIKCFSNEIKASKTKLNSTEDNEEKEKLKKYIKSLEDAKDKLDIYYNELLTEKEQEDRYDQIDDDDLDDYELDDDFDFDDDDDFDFDDDFLENTVLGKLNNLINDIISINESNIINQASMYHLISKASDHDIINIAKVASKYPDVFYKESVEDGIKDNIRDIRTGKIDYKSALNKSLRLSSLTTAASIMENNYDNEPVYTIYEAVDVLDSINDAYRAISIMIETYTNRNQLLEASITNTLNVASMKLRNAFNKMSDKERSISRSLDIGMNNLKKSIERALTNDNRESVIKGSILPSFSKLVKLCIVNAGLIALHQPLIALIGTLGYIGVNSKFKAKERQMVVDEIEIELEMCEKYINIAEQKNDMKALKQLLTTKKELERQRQRVKYKMKVDFGQKYYDSNSAGDNN